MPCIRLWLWSIHVLPSYCRLQGLSAGSVSLLCSAQCLAQHWYEMLIRWNIVEALADLMSLMFSILIGRSGGLTLVKILWPDKYSEVLGIFTANHVSPKSQVRWINCGAVCQYCHKTAVLPLSCVVMSSSYAHSVPLINVLENVCFFGFCSRLLISFCNQAWKATE